MDKIELKILKYYTWVNSCKKAHIIVYIYIQIYFFFHKMLTFQILRGIINYNRDSLISSKYITYQFRNDIGPTIV